MKQVTIRFLGVGYNDLCQALVTIYDINDNVIWKGFTYNSKLKICLKINCYYRVCAILNNNVINQVFRVDRRNVYVFIFNSIVVNENVIQNPITFLLTDANYLDLPIQKGRVIIWQK